MTQQTLFQREVLINAPLAHVWQLVATEEGLRQWWGNPIFLEAKEGGRCEEWRQSQERTTRWQGVVTLYAPPHQLMLTLRAEEAQEGPELTTIAIALEAKGDATSVYVTQRAFGPSAAIRQPHTRDEKAVPNTPSGVPLAQLARPHPGAWPGAIAAPRVGQVAPTYTLLATRHREALMVLWEQRLATLVTVTPAPVTTE